jgi:RNA-directed DNA polymerase
MDFKQYEQLFRLKAQQELVNEADIEKSLKYAKSLVDIGVPIIYDQNHFSLLCGVRLYYLTNVSHFQPKYYKIYHIPKKSGGYREICEPYPTLKLVQEWILNNILNVVAEKYVSPVAKAYMPKRTIIDNVRFHRKKDIVLKIDLVDFFGSVNFYQVLNVFKSFGYNKPVSILLANLCTYEGKLPQGAPTSPMLSNFIFKEADDEIFWYCRANKIMYTRYADDLTFSGLFDIKSLFGILYRTLNRYGFSINTAKTQVLSRHISQRVTNIVVNNKIQCSREYRMRIRQEVYYIKKYGLDSHIKAINTPLTADQYLASLRGKVGYALFINKKDEELQRYRKYLYELAKARDAIRDV